MPYWFGAVGVLHGRAGDEEANGMLILCLGSAVVSFGEDGRLGYCVRERLDELEHVEVESEEQLEELLREGEDEEEELRLKSVRVGEVVAKLLESDRMTGTWTSLRMTMSEI